MIRGRGTALRLPVVAISRADRKGDRKGRPYKSRRRTSDLPMLAADDPLLGHGDEIGDVNDVVVVEVVRRHVGAERACH